MTSVNDTLKDRANNLGRGRTETDGTTSTSFGDPSGEHPRFEYINSSPVNIGARTGKMHKLSFGGAASGVPASATSSLGNQYPLNDVRETVSGHVLEFNDTPGGERILIKHNSGSGIEMRPDGTIIVSTLNNKVEVCNGDNTVIVEGDARMIYKGSLTMDITGDFNINCMNFNVNTKGDKVDNIGGSYKASTYGNYSSKVAGHKTETIAQSVTQTYLGNVDTSIKGTFNTAVQGDLEMVAQGCICSTSETEYVISTPNLNMAATSLSVFGATGTIGGENIIHYGKNYYGVSATMSEGITAPTFHGDVDGTAAFAVQADVTNSQNYADTDPGGDVGSAQGYSITNTATNTAATAKPTTTNVSAYLTKSAKGIREVLIDAGDFLKKSLLTKKETPEEVRAKLRDPSNLNNPEITTRAVGEGKLNPNFAQAAPPKGFGRIRDPEPGCERGNVQPGNADKTGSNKTFRRQESYQRRARVLIPELKFNVNNTPDININTKLAPGITMAKFLGGKSSADFRNLSLIERRQLARNYYLHSQIIKYVMSRPGLQPNDFADFRLEVAEGYYKTARYGIPIGVNLAPEVLTEGSNLWKRSKGQLVVYELIDDEGKIDIDGTFELATYLKDKCSHLFNKLILDYDEFDPSGDLNVQLMIEVADVPADFTINSRGLVETMYNGKVQGKNSLIEVLPTKEPASADPVVTAAEGAPAKNESILANNEEAALRDKWSAAYNAYLDKSLAIRTEEAVKLSYIQSKKWFSDNEQASKLKVIADQYQKEWYDWREANGLSRAPTS
jgi:hypothetical protein